MKKREVFLQKILQRDNVGIDATIEDYNSIISKLDKILQGKRQDVEGAPKGKIKINPHKNGYQYYFKENSGSSWKYMSKKDDLIIKELLQKRYDNRVVRELESLIRYLKVSRNNINSLKSIQSAYSNLPDEAKKLITPLDISDEDYKELWLEEVSKKTSTNSYPIDTDFYTDNGELVRSKSELNIANLLKKHGLLYKYELPVKLDNYGTIYPDFTVLDVKRRRVYYWEHRGLMDDAMYAEKAVKRLRDYEKNGIFLGEQLIITEETSGLPLGTRTIEDIIKHYFY